MERYPKSVPDVPGNDEKTVADPRHTLTLHKRTYTEMNGVTEVLRFDEERVVLVTDCGQLTVEGRGISIRVLDVEKGLVSFDGQVDGILYEGAPGEKTKKTQGILARLFG